jgi:uncharacterized caspase-like protein
VVPKTSAVVNQIEFGADDVLRATGALGSTARVWNLGPLDDRIVLPGSILNVTSSTWVKSGEMLAIASPLQLIIWDVQRQTKVREETISADGWPLACSPSGHCAWEGTGSITIENAILGTERASLPCGTDRVLALAFSPDAKLLAAAVNRGVVRLWSLPSKKELPELRLSGAGDGVASVPPWMNGRKLFVPGQGEATALAFDASGSRLAASNDAGIQLWAVDGFQPTDSLKGPGGSAVSLAFAANGRFLYATTATGFLEWQLAPRGEATLIGVMGETPLSLGVRRDHRFAAITMASGRTELWSLAERRKVVDIHFLNDGGWLATTPDGLFEGSEEAWRQAQWRFKGAHPSTEPIERYFFDFYRPGLISQTLNGKGVRPAPNDLDWLDRKVPSVTLTLLADTPAAAVLVPGEGIRTTRARARFRVTAQAATPRSGIKSVELAHNGIVVRRWEQPKTTGKSFKEEVDVELSPADNIVTAHASNVDRVQSEDVSWKRAQQGFGYMVQPCTLYVVAVGIDDYRNPDHNLNYARADADLVAQTFSRPDQDWERQGSVSQNRASSLAIGTLQSQRQTCVPAHSSVVELADAAATRHGVLEAIRNVVHSAGPDDAMLIYLAGHGQSDDSHFYFLPYDQRLLPTKRGVKGPPGPSAVKSTLISDEDLEHELRGVNIGQGAIVLDACDSGAALANSDLRGPQDARGLARLAYESGIALLAAASGNAAAHELPSQKQGALTYALIKEGLIKGKADMQPRDGQIELQEWLSYGSVRLPSLLAEQSTPAGQRSSASEDRPVYAPRRIPQARSLVLSVATESP